MNTVRHEYDIGDKVYLHLDTGCTKGEVVSVIVTVVNGEVQESYQINCTEGTIVADSAHVGFTRDDVIEKLIKVQAESLSMFQKFINKYLVGNNYKTGSEITVFNRLHRQGYVLVNHEEIKLIHFDKVEYIKCTEGIEVRFHHDGKYSNEAYATITEATARLRERFKKLVKTVEVVEET